MRTFEVIPDIA